MTGIQFNRDIEPPGAKNIIGADQRAASSSNHNSSTSAEPILLDSFNTQTEQAEADGIINSRQLSTGELARTALLKAEIGAITSAIPDVANRLGLNNTGGVSIDIKNLPSALEKSKALANVLEKTGQMVFVIDDQDCFRPGGSLGASPENLNFVEKEKYFKNVYDPNIKALMKNSLLTAVTGDAHELDNPTIAPIKPLQVAPIIKSVPTSDGKFTEWVWPPHGIANDSSGQGSRVVASDVNEAAPLSMPKGYCFTPEDITVLKAATFDRLPQVLKNISDDDFSVIYEYIARDIGQDLSKLSSLNTRSDRIAKYLFDEIESQR